MIVIRPDKIWFRCGGYEVSSARSDVAGSSLIQGSEFNWMLVLAHEIFITNFPIYSDT